jgi:hypothetical protein
MLVLALLTFGGTDRGVAIAARPSAAEAQVDRSDIDEALRRVNEIRDAAGLDRVSLDPTMSAACEKHAWYLILNASSPAVAGLLCHQEQPGLPGYSPEGDHAGRNAVISRGGALANAVFHWEETLYHRRPMLEPGLRTVGMGCVKGSHGQIESVLMFGPSSADAGAYPVRYPADGADDVRLNYNPFEIPDPVPGGGQDGGFPITLQFQSWAQVSGVSASLVDDDGDAVPFYLSSPERPAGSFPQGGVVCLIPKRPLKPSTRYRVSVTATVDRAGPQTWDWRFTTLTPRQVNVGDPSALRAAVERIGYFVGDVIDADTVGTETYVRLRTGAGMQVSSILTPALWNQLRASGFSKATMLKGKRVRILGTAREIVPGDITLYLNAGSELSVLGGR